MSKMRKVRLQLVEVRPDPIQFKPYSPAFAPERLFLDVDIPSAYVVTEVSSSSTSKVEGGAVVATTDTVLTMEGFQYLLQVLADGVADMHSNRLKEMGKA